MKEPQNQLKEKTLILTHGDSDGYMLGSTGKERFP